MFLEGTEAMVLRLQKAEKGQHRPDEIIKWSRPGGEGGFYISLSRSRRKAGLVSLSELGGTGKPETREAQELGCSLFDWGG